ncbi:MAG TPA: hypothetical protein VF941_07695 [Clostridia bacterium]
MNTVNLLKLVEKARKMASSNIWGENAYEAIDNTIICNAKSLIHSAFAKIPEALDILLVIM